MLEPIFCRGVANVSLCSWSWYFVVAVVVVFIAWKLLMPKKQIH